MRTGRVGPPHSSIPERRRRRRAGSPGRGARQTRDEGARLPRRERPSRLTVTAPPGSTPRRAMSSAFMRSPSSRWSSLQPLDDAGEVDAAMAEAGVLRHEEEAALAFWGLGRRLAGGSAALRRPALAGRHRLHAPRRPVALGREARHRGADRRAHGGGVRVLQVGVASRPARSEKIFQSGRANPWTAPAGRCSTRRQLLHAPLDVRERARRPRRRRPPAGTRPHRTAAGTGPARSGSRSRAAW